MHDETVDLKSLSDTLRWVLPEAVAETADSAELLGGYARYESLGLIGQGGMGRVFEAQDRQFGRILALKEGLETFTTEDTHRFLQEAVITGNLEHPGIPVVYERGLTGEGRPFFSMARIEGRTLSEEIDGALTEDERLRLISVVISVAQTLAYAQGRGVVHRDIKPSNIIVGDYGDVAVIDWGIAKVRGIMRDDSSLNAALEEVCSGDTTHVDQVLGTPTHMAPEQASGDINEVDRRTDVFALGALLYHIIAGRPPYRGSSPLETIRKAHAVDFEALESLAPKVDPALLSIVERAMSRNKEQRYEGASEMAHALEGWLASAASKEPGSAFTRWYAAGVSALMLVFVAGLLVASFVTTPLMQIGVLALFSLAFGFSGCLLSLIEWRTLGRHQLSSLSLALVGISLLIGTANTLVGELQALEFLSSPAMMADPERIELFRESSRMVVLYSLPIVLVMVTVQLVLWALASRAVARARARGA